ncbi:MAG TPA: ATP-binding protein [Desulfobacterales bacterium]|nr:ATP-binding protein [Desulfobacterales bacterium]
MNSLEHFKKVIFHRYKGFFDYSVSLRNFNILVGPNNCGKSTILGAFRILSEAIRKARAKNPELLEGLKGKTYGYNIDLSNIPISTENIFYDYDESEPATVKFQISNGNELILYFPEVGRCYLFCEATNRIIRSVAHFKKVFNLQIGFVPILGPVEHDEQLFQKEAARLALLTHRASRNFRNIWYHYPEDFKEFRELVKTTWPGMDIEAPQIDQTHSPTRLHMFSPEERIHREIYWGGFGFQVWCQMLTFIIRGKNSSIFIIDEPDIYLHSDLQRQLMSILRSLGPDILIATHSTEIISESEPDDILVVNKKNVSAKRIRQPGELQQIFQVLGSNLNPTLTQLAKTKRALFVEGKDFQIISRFARILGNIRVANRGNFAIIPVEGFNPTKVRNFIEGIKLTLGCAIISAIIFDRDYRSEKECTEIQMNLENDCVFARIHSRKEIENFLIVPQILLRAINSRINEHNKRTGENKSFNEDICTILGSITSEMRYRIEAQYLERQKPFMKAQNRDFADPTITEYLMAEFESTWNNLDHRLRIVPGKETLSTLNTYLQNEYGVTITFTLIVNSFILEEIDPEMINLIAQIDHFSKQNP